MCGIRKRPTVKTIEENEKYTDTWRKAKDTLLRKAVGLDFAIFEGSHQILLVLVAPIQRGEVQVRRCVGNVEVGTVCSKDVVNDDGC
jgi:hypothetical protein